VTWPIGMGSRLKGVYHLVDDEVHLFEPGRNFTRQDSTILKLDDPALRARIGEEAWKELHDELELVKGASHPFDADAYLAGRQTPVFFGSAVNNFGVQLLLDFFVRHAPARSRSATRSPRASRCRSPASPTSRRSCSAARGSRIR